MANNKIILGDEVLIDLTGDTVTPETLAEGYTAHAANGELIVGTAKGGTVDMSKYFETTSGDTLTWEGNTDDKEVHDISFAMPNFDGTLLAVKMSDVVPTVEQLNKLGSVDYNYLVDGVLRSEESDKFRTFYDMYGDGSIYLGMCSDYETPLSLVVMRDITLPDGSIASSGVYFIKMFAIDGSLQLTFYTTSVTLNGCNFNKEVIKNVYLDFIETVGNNTLTWDGNTSGMTYYDISAILSQNNGVMIATKISDSVPTIEQLNAGVSLTGCSRYKENKVENSRETFTINTFEDMFGDGNAYVCNYPQFPLPMFFVLMNDMEMNGVTAPKGVYFILIDLSIIESPLLEMYTTSVTFNGYTFKNEVIKEAYLPKTVVTKSDLEAYIESALLGGAW